eukprot:gene10655-13052_t
MSSLEEEPTTNSPSIVDSSTVATQAPLSSSSLSIEERKKEEQRRNEARKRRILSNTKNRIDYVSDRSTSLETPPPPPTAPQQQDQSSTSTNEQQQSTENTTTKKTIKSSDIFKKNREIREPLSYSILRWIGVFFFSSIYTSNAILSTSPQLLNSTSSQTQLLTIHKWLFDFVTGINTTNNARYILMSGIPILLWFIWEYLFIYRNRPQKTTTLLSIMRSDGLLIAFFYVVSVDLFLRFQHYFVEPHLQNTEGLEPYFIEGLYYPLIVAIIGQFGIDKVPNQFPIIKMNDTFIKAYTTLSHIVLSILMLLVFLDSWGCSSMHCKSFGLMWIISSKSRGLLLWSHICINFASRLLGSI